MTAHQPYAALWSRSEPTAVTTTYTSISQVDGFAGSASLSVSANASGTSDPNWLWKDSTCV